MSQLEERHYLSNGDAVEVDAREALGWAKGAQVKMVDLEFCDLFGTWQHATLPLGAVDERSFEEGLGFDGSSLRGSLAAALDALEADHEFLTRDGVFPEELVATWIDWKRRHELDEVRLRPHPAEFALYFGC